jgi:hypothetical protein
VVVLLVVAGITALRGGILFSPGGLNARTGGILGGVSAHSQITACSTCHPAFWSGQTLSDRCILCHTDISAQVKSGQGLHGALPKFGSYPCQQCHPDHLGPNSSMTVIDPLSFPHQVTGYALTGHKINGDRPFVCADCHPSGLASFEITTCKTCHLSVNGQFMQGHLAAFTGACLNCHDGIDTYGPNFSHNNAAFPLMGKHANLDCQACHKAQVLLRIVKSTPQECAACHAKDDAHLGQLGTDCGACHTPKGWSEAAVDHTKLGFPLTGKHASAACQACHADNIFAQTPTDCVACHQKDNIHGTDLGLHCEQCHTSDGWIPATFDHTLSGFVLIGTHAQTACQSCHINNQWKGLPTTCFGCHQKDDRHNGQFGQDCSLCHVPTTWSQITFDHAKSAFPLTGAHISLACSTCHQNGVFAGTPSQCSACHAEPDYHRGLFGSNCAACHSTSAWVPASFNGPHSFPMDHGGAGGNCRTCHPSSLAGYTCFSCHSPGSVQNSHEGLSLQQIANCVKCHPNGQSGD